MDGPEAQDESNVPFQTGELRHPERTDRLARTAQAITKRILRYHGSAVSDHHDQLLLDLQTLFTYIANDHDDGRYVFDMPTGGGKTTAAVAFTQAVVRFGPSEWSMAICAGQVADLIDIKQQLRSEPYPVADDDVGLWHAKADAAEPPTFSKDDSHRYGERRILLTTHSRAQRQEETSAALRYRGRPRNLVVYDESLITRGHQLYDHSRLQGQLEELLTYLGRESPESRPFRALKDALSEQATRLESGGEPELVDLPWLGSGPDRHLVEAAEGKLGDLSRETQDTVRFLKQGASAARLVNVPGTSSGTQVVHAFPKVPDDLDRMVVLDASFPVRTLLKLSNARVPSPYRDIALTHIHDRNPHDRSSEVPVQFKRYDHVTLNWMKTKGSGRGYLKRDFEKPRGQSEVDREVAQLVARDLPSDKAVLIWTFKQREGEPDFRGRLLQALRDEDVNTTAKVDVGDTEKDRINVETFGRETSTNALKHCEYVIFTGGLEQHLDELAGSYLSEVRDITAEVTKEDITAMNRGEVWHSVVQAMSRGTMRDVWVDGNGQSQAKPMAVYLMSRHPQAQAELGRVLPGAQWTEWAPRVIGRSAPGKAEDIAEVIQDILAEQPKERLQVSAKSVAPEVNRRLGFKPPTKTFQRARDRALETAPWSYDGRSFLRQS